MLRKILEKSLGKMTDSQFAVLMDLTTLDIKVNRVGFRERTSLSYVVQVAEITHGILRKVG